MKWEDTVLSREEFFLLAKAHDYDYQYACEAQAKKSFEAGRESVLAELGFDYYKYKPEPFACRTCGGTGEVPVPAGDYPLSVRMRPCPDCNPPGVLT